MRPDQAISDPTINTHAETSPALSPRAFATGTGYCFQIAGVLFMAAGSAGWAMSGRLLPPNPMPAEHWSEFLAPERRVTGALAIGLVGTIVGGIALATVGLGLQGEIRSAGPLAIGVPAILALIYGAVIVLLLTAPRGVFALGPPVLFGFASFLLLLLGRHGAAVLRRFPPPPDQNRATDEILREYERRRAERRKTL